jgi:hypothetical protein
MAVITFQRVVIIAEDQTGNTVIKCFVVPFPMARCAFCADLLKLIRSAVTRGARLLSVEAVERPSAARLVIERLQNTWAVTLQAIVLVTGMATETSPMLLFFGFPVIF